MQQGEVLFMKMRLFLRSRAGLTLILSLVASLMLVAANTRTSKSSVSPLAQKEIVKAKTHAPKLQILPRPKQRTQGLHLVALVFLGGGGAARPAGVRACPLKDGHGYLCVASPHQSLRAHHWSAWIVACDYQ
jgi:hypothetical protein